jgi:RNA polymerase sigma factor (sigma-70 family)
MNYDEIENLVHLSKTGDTNAKETLIWEFTPLISNLSRKSFIDSYEVADIRNECFKTLFKCVRLYNSDKHRFVGYATNAIKNSINHLIRVSIRRNKTEGREAFILDGKMENILYYNEGTDTILLSELYQPSLKAALESLALKEQDLVNFVYFKKYSLRRYSEFKGISYSTVVNRKGRILRKLRKALNMPSDDDYKKMQ